MAKFKVPTTSKQNYIDAMHEAPITPEALDAAKDAMYVAMAEKMKTAGRL